MIQNSSSCKQELLVQPIFIIHVWRVHANMEHLLHCICVFVYVGLGLADMSSCAGFVEHKSP